MISRLARALFDAVLNDDVLFPDAILVGPATLASAIMEDGPGHFIAYGSDPKFIGTRIIIDPDKREGWALMRREMPLGDPYAINEPVDWKLHRKTGWTIYHEGIVE